jgi:iron-sulfur cluster assembly accessory protein
MPAVAVQIIFFLIACVALSSAFLHPFSSRISKQSAYKVRSTKTETESPAAIEAPIVAISEKAKIHLRKIKQENQDVILRMGVTSGGCSGLSYSMQFITPSQVSEDDSVETYEDIKCVIDPKSLIYLYGLQLDYSDELIGGGFKFTNPNAQTAW